MNFILIGLVVIFVILLVNGFFGSSKKPNETNSPLFLDDGHGSDFSGND